MKHYFLLVFVLLCWGEIIAQKGFKPNIGNYYDEQIKKENGKVGLWSKSSKKWMVLPEYEEVLPVVLIEDNRLVQNANFNKFVRKGSFDVVQKIPRKTDAYSGRFDYMEYHYEIVLREVEDFVPVHNYVFYKKNGKWGWLLKSFNSQKEKFDEQSSGTYLQPPVFDDIPLFTNIASTYYPKGYDPDFLLSHYKINAFMLMADSAGYAGLYDCLGKTIIPPGQYSGFSRIPFSGTLLGNSLVIVEGKNGLIGYVYGDRIIDPQYTHISKQKILYAEGSYRYKPIEYSLLSCKLPNGEFDIREGAELRPPNYVTQIEKLIEDAKAKDIELEKLAVVEREEKAKNELKGLINYYSGFTFFASPNGMGIKRYDGSIVMYPALHAVTIGSRCFYYTAANKIGCKENGTIIKSEAEDLKCDLTNPYGDIKIELIGQGEFKVRRMEDLQKEGKTQKGQCFQCRGTGEILLSSEKVVTRSEQTIRNSGKCYSCGDVVTQQGNLITVSVKTYESSYTIPEETKIKYTYGPCPQCSKTGFTNRGYKYNNQTKLYDWYGQIPEKIKRVGRFSLRTE